MVASPLLIARRRNGNTAPRANDHRGSWEWEKECTIMVHGTVGNRGSYGKVRTPLNHSVPEHFEIGGERRGQQCKLRQATTGLRPGGAGAATTQTLPLEAHSVHGPAVLSELGESPTLRPAVKARGTTGERAVEGVRMGNVYEHLPLLEAGEPQPQPNAHAQRSLRRAVVAGIRRRGRPRLLRGDGREGW